MNRLKCECGTEYKAWRSQCPSCHRTVESARKQTGTFYTAEPYTPDEELGNILNKYAKNGFSLVRWFRNEPSRGGTENSTLVFKTRTYEGDDIREDK